MAFGLIRTRVEPEAAHVSALKRVTQAKPLPRLSEVHVRFEERLMLWPELQAHRSGFFVRWEAAMDF